MKESLRSLIPGLQNKIYFNYGGQGPLPKTSLDEIIKSWKIIQEMGPFTNNVWPFINREIILTKHVLANKLGVNIKNIALSENISSGMILPLWGMTFKDGEELLISDCEHPGVVAACRELCKRNNLKFKIFPIQKIETLNDEIIISEIKKYLNQKTRIVVCSHILWNFGYEIPLSKLRNELDKLPIKPYLIVDGAQSFGHIAIENTVKYSDLYSITSHKWACGPEGLGAFFISDRFLKNSSPTIIGWKSLKKEVGIYESSNKIFHEDARKFEVATSCIPLLAGLRESLNLFEKHLSKEAKHKYITSMSNLLWFKLSKLESVNLILKEPLTNGIVSFNIEQLKNKNSFVKHLGEKNIWIRLVEDPQWFRACIHQTTTEEEINLLVTKIKIILG